MTSNFSESFNEKYLIFLLSVAKVGSFREAARALGVRPSSVSRAIRHLEDNLGVALFERKTSGVRLTNAGRCFQNEVAIALAQIERARKTAAAAGRGEIGRLRIGVLTSLAGGFLRGLLAAHALEQPAISVDIHDASRRDQLAAIRSRALDIAFLTGASVVRGCETAELWQERLHLAMPRDHRLASRRRLDWSDLHSERFIVSHFPPGPEVHDYIVRRASDYSTYPSIEFQAVRLGTLLNLVGLGQGITVVSEAVAAAKLPNVVLRPLTNPEDMMPMSAVWSPKNDNPALRRFISLAHVLAGRVRPGSSDWTHRVA
ncbi:LysR family transcriptional regulator [Consotaella salsifontis]|uniref:DNA-binding transcriptional regulator, LysR family n=1 Tax=Consotaella salsifontis TaxID=1365950 RepID=A0A1T4RK26_9HYPH|nr:LysR family transcriptional regulator [Consotaella salsifontis]SKA16344.1 DNA-binding transcriptional regulator, LysR family [Consotaella salsifontis]